MSEPFNNRKTGRNMPKTDIPTRLLRKGDVLFREGETGTEAYLIKNGYVSVSKMDKGKRVNLAAKAEGEIVGEMALIDDTTRSATVVAESDIEVVIITKKELEDMLAGSPKTLAAIIHQLLESLRCANDIIAMYASRPTSNKAD